MIRSRILLKTIAIFLIIESIVSTVAPAVSWALTAGPTAPEASTFEPVDTTDMVDLKTGDFNYNLPLFEIPGPAGSYPISLSHHANVQLDQEASWVGSSWNLNPGAITRFVNGYPDDHQAIDNVTREYWEGGHVETYTVGLGVGIANTGVSVTASMSFANDTYRGRGYGWSVGGGYSPVGSDRGINAQVGGGAYGGSYQSVGVGLGGSTGFNVGLSVTNSSQSGLSAGMSAGISVANNSLLGASLSTNKDGVTMKATTGPVSVHNNKAGKVSSKEDNFMIDIPIWYLNLRLGRNYQRYWIDETETVKTYGSIYSAGVETGFESALDTYQLPDKDLDMGEHANPERLLGGSFPDVDFYSVTAQGLGGAMRPHYYKKKAYTQDKKVDDEVIKANYAIGNSTSQSEEAPADFRFVNDFSNRLEYDPSDFSVTNGVLNYSFNSTYSTGPNGNDGYINERLPGSRHIQTFTNSDILGSDPARREGFIDAVSQGFLRTTNAQIGAFSITNESGVTYHYALPAYSFGERMKSQNTKKQQESNGLYYNQLNRPTKYAYSWFLTAITGPDFVDRNQNNLADAGDWGYWVRFDYSKWLENYQWRNPAEGLNTDIDDFEFFSGGYKEIYYLDKIFTQSHVAVFNKSERYDSREVSDIMLGGFNPVIVGEQTVTPRPCLKLDNIVLYDVKDYPGGTNSLRTIHFTYDYSLALGTPNSYSSNSSEKLGKLTLKSVDFRGKNNGSYLPKISFQYKNAEYQKDSHDAWGYYKNDYVNTGSKAVDRLTTSTSANDVDAWALTRIKTTMGSVIEIDYESDQYRNSPLFKKNLLKVNSFTLDQANNRVRIQFENPISNLESDILKNSHIEFMFRREFRSDVECSCSGKAFGPGESMGNYYDFKDVTLTPEIVTNVESNAISFQSPDLFNYLSTGGITSTYTTSPCQNSSGSFSPSIWIDHPLLVAGNLFYDAINYGGGTRVKEISVRNFRNISTTSYLYENGTTTYGPDGIGDAGYNFDGWESNQWAPEMNSIDIAKRIYNRKIYQELPNLLAIARELPGPGVIYERVTVKHTFTQDLGVPVEDPTYSTFHFEVFNNSMIGVINTPVQSSYAAGTFENISYSEIHRRKVVIKDLTARIGVLKDVMTYTKDGIPLKKTENIYLHDGLDAADTFTDQAQQYEADLSSQFNNQGLVEETAVGAQIVKLPENSLYPYGVWQGHLVPADTRHLLGVISKKETLPVVQTETRVTDFKTGIQNSSTTLAFDFFSGATTQSRVTDGYGNIFITENRPAYKEYQGMGLKVQGGANMLTQQGLSYTYKINGSNNITGLVGASVQTWSDQVPSIRIGDTESDAVAQEGIWRMKSSYSFIGDNAIRESDGLFPLTTLPDFTGWTTGEPSSQWQKNTEVSLYDIYSHSLEERDVNDQFSSTLMSVDQSKVFATVSGGTYSEFIFTSAEETPFNNKLSGQIGLGDGTINETLGHAGTNSLKIDPSGDGLQFAVKTSSKRRSLHMSVWIHQNGATGALFKYQVSGNGQSFPVENVGFVANPKRKAGDWYLFEVQIPIPQNPGQSVEYTVTGSFGNSGSASINVDDFRMCPTDAGMTSYVYNQWGELSFILDNNNLFTKFEYDLAGRLVKTYKETFSNGVVKTNELSLHYAPAN